MNALLRRSAASSALGTSGGGKIVSAIGNDVVMPPIGRVLGGVDFSSLFLDLSGGEYASLALAEAAGAPLIKYGVFINTVLDFLIVAFAIFMVIKGMNTLKKKEEEAPAEPPKPSAEVELLTEIRDALRNR